MAFVPIAAEKNVGLWELKDRIVAALRLMKIYTKRKGEAADMDEPLIVRANSTVGDVCEKLHRDLKKEFRYALLDRYDREKRVTSMARTTGYMATAAARLIRDGVFNRLGVSPPEYLGMEEGCYTALLSGLRVHGVLVRSESA